MSTGRISRPIPDLPSHPYYSSRRSVVVFLAAYDGLAHDGGQVGQSLGIPFAPYPACRTEVASEDLKPEPRALVEPRARVVGPDRKSLLLVSPISNMPLGSRPPHKSRCTLSFAGTHASCPAVPVSYPPRRPADDSSYSHLYAQLTPSKCYYNIGRPLRRHPNRQTGLGGAPYAGQRSQNDTDVGSSLLPQAWVHFRFYALVGLDQDVLPNQRSLTPHQS